MHLKREFLKKSYLSFKKSSLKLSLFSEEGFKSHERKGPQPFSLLWGNLPKVQPFGLDVMSMLLNALCYKTPCTYLRLGKLRKGLSYPLIVHI